MNFRTKHVVTLDQFIQKRSRLIQNEQIAVGKVDIGQTAGLFNQKKPSQFKSMATSVEATNVSRRQYSSNNSNQTSPVATTRSKKRLKILMGSMQRPRSKLNMEVRSKCLSIQVGHSGGEKEEPYYASMEPSPSRNFTGNGPQRDYSQTIEHKQRMSALGVYGSAQQPRSRQGGRNKLKHVFKSLDLKSSLMQQYKLRTPVVLPSDGQHTHLPSPGKQSAVGQSMDLSSLAYSNERSQQRPNPKLDRFKLLMKQKTRAGK